MLVDNLHCSLKTLDRHLHRCVYDRKYSLLPCVGRDFCDEANSVHLCDRLSPVSNCVTRSESNPRLNRKNQIFDLRFLASKCKSELEISNEDG